MQVHKLRGSWFMSGRHSYRITSAGHTIYPRVEALLEVPSVWDSADGPEVTTGIPGIDDMLGGGVDTHSVTIVLGPSGSGKTTAGLQFLTGGPAHEPAMLFGFHENPMALKIKADALQLSLSSRMDNISLMWRPQTEAILDEVATELFDAIKARGIKRLVIDGIEGFSKLTNDKSRIGSFLSALCNELRALGVATLATVETDHAGMTPGQPLAGVNQTGLSAVAENIIALHLAALRSENHRLLTILKSRDRQTDMRMRRFDIVAGGIVLDKDSTRAEQILQDIASQGPLPPASGDRKLTGP